MNSDEFIEKQKELYAKAKEQTIETLPDFMEEVLSVDHTYESIVPAIAMCAVAAAYAADNHPNGGITGWQATFVMWEFLAHWMQKEDSVGMKLIDFWMEN